MGRRQRTKTIKIVIKYNKEVICKIDREKETTTNTNNIYIKCNKYVICKIDRDKVAAAAK